LTSTPVLLTRPTTEPGPSRRVGPALFRVALVLEEDQLSLPRWAILAQFVCTVVIFLFFRARVRRRHQGDVSASAALVAMGQIFLVSAMTGIFIIILVSLLE
jgi:hypothetical protein